MRVTVLLPDLARVMTGKRKKQYAWAYLQQYYPAYVPLSVQERLEEDNVLICDIDFDKQRRLTAEVNARRAANKANKPKKGRK
jgi:hypothetical protein